MPPRHSLAWLTPAGWDQARQHAAADCLAPIDEWQREDWPAIVRRPDADAGEGECALGIAPPPLPDGSGKKRIGLRVPFRLLSRVRAPLTLREALAAAPAAWNSALEDLAGQAEREGLAMHVYGSLALQALTGRDYLRPSSDIDLLLMPATREQLCRGVDLLQAALARLPLDGELVFPGGLAVAWKEWLAATHAASATRVLVKELQRVYLAHPTQLLARFESESWPA